MEQLDDDKLQQYFDGELAPAEADEVQRALERSPDLAGRRAALERLHDFVVMHSQMQHPGLSAQELFARISEGIATEQAEGRHETLRPMEGGHKTTPPIAPRGNRPVEGWKVWAPVFAAAAAAVLAYAFWGGGQASTTDVEPPTVVIEDSQMNVEAPGGLVIVEAPQGSEVEEVDFGTNVGTVFEVEGEAGEPIAVVWIMEDEPEQATQ